MLSPYRDRRAWASLMGGDIQANVKYTDYRIFDLSCSWSEVSIGNYQPARARLRLYRQQYTHYTPNLHASQPSIRERATRQNLNTPIIECTEGRRALAALLFTADALTLLARGADKAFMRYCNKPDASLPARQTEWTAFRRFYRSCCCCCSPPWWTAHSTAVRTPQRSHEGLTSNTPDWNYRSLRAESIEIYVLCLE